MEADGFCTYIFRFAPIFLYDEKMMADPKLDPSTIRFHDLDLISICAGIEGGQTLFTRIISAIHLVLIDVDENSTLFFSERNDFSFHFLPEFAVFADSAVCVQIFNGICVSVVFVCIYVYLVEVARFL